jgi:hypothetical protein
VCWKVAEVDSFEQRYWIRMHSKVSQVPQVPNGPSLSHSSAGLQRFKEGEEETGRQHGSMNHQWNIQKENMVAEQK